MTVSIQPHQIGCGGDITTMSTNTMTAIEIKKKRAYRRKDCGDTITSTVTEKEKRLYRRKDCGDTDTSTVMEKEKRPYRRKDCGDTITSTVMERKKRPYRKKDCGDTITSTVMEKKKRPYRRKDCGDTITSTVMERKKRPYRREDCCDSDTSTVMKKRKNCGDTTNISTVIEKKNKACKRKDCGDTTNTSTVMKKRKDFGDTITSTVMEKKKKRPYTRKDCGDTITSTVMEKKKSPYRTKDCGDTDTSTVIEKKKKACKRKDCGDTTNMSLVTEKKKKTYGRKKYLPHDLIVEEILTKLPVRTLLKSVLVSKLWYDSIHNDHKRLTYSHFLQSQKQPDIVLSLSNVRSGFEKTGDASYGCHFFKLTTGIYSHHKNVLRFDKFLCGLTHRDVWELVGYCNGLPCMAQVGYYSTGYVILDPNRNDCLYIFYPVRVGIRTPNAHIICHGFGFDSSANEYKMVSIFRTAQKELNFVVFTLGTKSWRNVTATTTPMSGHGGRLITKIRGPTGSDKSAIFCSASSSSGCLVWKIIATLAGTGSDDIQHDNSSDVGSEMEMLLLFNLHDEKFHFIQPPAKSSTDEQQKHLLVDYPHLLEFKGSPCIARIQKIPGNGSDYPHRCRDDHQGSSSCCCCCCCKVHLYVLKDNAKQVWINEESFDVRIDSNRTWLGDIGKLAPEPCCFCFGSTTTTPPTCIFSFSDQMLLYWLNGNCLQVYNLRSEKLQLVESYRKEAAIFQAKMEEPRHIFNSGNDDIYCSTMDYQLHCHEDNFLSLQTFIPEGVEGVAADAFLKLESQRKDSPFWAFGYIYRGSHLYYPFL